jgi:chlorobactene glucosyltransferase
MKTFWEKAVLPFLHFTTFCFLPLPLVKAVRDSRLAMAVGQFMLFRRAAYEAVGGHRAVKDVMVEDVWMSRLIKKHGFALRVLDGGSVVSCRMYASFNEIWYGFSKNLFPGFKFSVPAIVLVILFNFATSVLPFVSLAAIIAGALPENLLPVVLAQIGLLLAIRLSLSVRFSMSYAAVLVHPIAMLVVIAMALNSMRWVLLAGGSRWKGRSYEFRKRNLATIQGEQ